MTISELGEQIIVWFIIIVVCLVVMAIPFTAWNVYSNGVPKTHKGSIIYVEHSYNKLLGYKSTNVEVLTYSGDSHHIWFWDHIEFDLGETYIIHTVIDNRLTILGWMGNERMVEYNKVDTT